MVTYLINGNQISEAMAFDRFRRFQVRVRGTPEGVSVIRCIWESCHTNVETRMRELPDNLEIVVE